MTPLRIGAFALIVLGALGLAFGTFTYTKESREAKVGPLEFTVKDKESIEIPKWLGVGAVVIGGLMLLAPGKRR